jgi:hypothetical protein
MPDVVVLLNTLAELQRERDARTQEHVAARDALIPEDICRALAELDAQHAAHMASFTLQIEGIEAEVKRETLRLGVSVKGTQLHAVYTTGRVNWDDAFLQGYAAVHPEILQARKEGQPSVSIRKVQL